MTFKGQYFWVKDSNHYTKPDSPIPLYIAGLRPLSAQPAGEEGDGFVTNEVDIESIKNKLLRAVKKAQKDWKGYDSIEKLLFIPASYNVSKERHYNQLDFGEVPS